MTDKKQKILLVEDNPADAALVRQMLCESLSFIRYDFTTAPRLADALDALDKEPFSLVLLDLNLLDSSGVATVSALHTSHPTLPIIVYSGVDDIHLQQQAILCGALHCAVKGKESGFVIKFMIEQATAA
jgi:DNA-binding NtrC family response regulator